MTILEALEEVKTQVSGLATLYYMGLNEANFDADALADTGYPLMIVLPITPVDDIGKSGSITTTFDFQFFILNKDTTQLTNEYVARTVEINIIAPMRQLGRRYIHKLNNHSIIDPETKGITSTIPWQPTYSSLDANVHGVFGRCTVSVKENPQVCTP